MTVLTIGITGKRNIKPEEKAMVIAELKANIDAVLAKHNTTRFKGLSGLAFGADALFAELVLDHYKKELTAILPFEQSEYEKDFEDKDTPEKLTKFREQLSKCTQVTVVNNALPQSPAQRNSFYFDAGKAIADDAEILIAVWDELKPESEGGTADVMGYFTAKKDLKKLCVINASPVNPNETQLLIKKNFDHSNKQAEIARDKHKRVWRSTIIFGWLAALVFAASLACGTKSPELTKCLLAFAESVTTIFTLALIRYARRKKFHKNYLSERLIAEKWRLLKTYYLMGASVQISGLTYRKDEVLTKTIKQINSVAEQSEYTSVWFNNYALKALIFKQKEYHDNRIERVGEKQKTLEKWNKLIRNILVVNILLHLLLKIKLAFFAKIYCIPGNVIDYIEHGTEFLSVFLTATYAAIEGWVFFEDWEILKKTSGNISKKLSDCEAELPVPSPEVNHEVCITAQIQSLHMLSDIMLTDNINWYTVFEGKADYHWVF